MSVCLNAKPTFCTADWEPVSGDDLQEDLTSGSEADPQEQVSLRI